MEEKVIKISNLEVKCEALIEFSSLANVLLELVRRQKETEKKLNDHDIKINNIKKIISSSGNSGGISWQEKENEISNILKDDDQFNINMNFNENNNSNISNDINNDNLKDNSKDENKREQIDENNENEDDNNKTDDNNESDKKYENNEKDENPEIDDNINKDEKNIANIKENGLNENEKEKKAEKVPQTYITNLVGKQSSNIPKENETKINTIPSSKEKKENDDVKMNISGISNKNNNDLVSKLFKSIVILEKKVNELTTKAGEHTIIFKNIQNNKKSISENIKKIDNLNEKFEKFKKEFDKMKVKLDDFNLFDMFKDSGDGNIDMAKGMVMALESKMKKRMDLFDEKYKVLSNENFKNKGDLQNLTGVVENSKLLIDKNKRSIDEIINGIKDKDIKDKEEKEKENAEIIQKINNVQTNVGNVETNSDNKIKNLEEKIKKDINSINVGGGVKSEKSAKKEVDKSIINSINEKILELEKNIKNIYKKMNLEDINNNLSVLQREIAKKGNQGAIDDLNDRINIYDSLMKEMNGKYDSYILIEQKKTEDITMLSNKIESLSNQFHRFSLNMNPSKREEKSIIDLTKFIDLNTFDDNKKEINKKFDKVRISFEDILRNIEEILNKLSHTPTDKDFAQYQGVIKNMIDELKLNCNKKYSDKYETIKSIKFLETQIKSINDQYVKKAEGQDNWLLAKKPLSKYLCASCEGVIRGELDNRCDYIPWNKYPNREERYSRMGHGFSHMLQLVNDDIRKNVDNKEKSKNKDKNNEKEYNSDEDKKKNISDKNLLVNTSVNVKLPKVKQRPRGNNNVNLNFLDEGVFDKIGHSPNVSDNNNTPQIIKISKLKKIQNKKSFQEPSLNDDNSNRGQNLNINTLPCELPSFEKTKGDFE